MSYQSQSGERTEKATPKRRREAREKGQVLKSAELVTSFSLLVMLGALALFAEAALNNTMQVMAAYLSGAVSIPPVMTVASVLPALAGAIRGFLLIVAPLLIAAAAAAVAFNMLQVGFLFSGKALAPKFERINMVAGFKRIFSARTLSQLMKAAIKAVLIGAVAYHEYVRRVEQLPALMTQQVPLAAAYVGSMLLAVGLKVAVALALLVPFDILFEWWRRERELRMTKQEVKEEYKLMEGDPKLKGRIRQKQRQISGMRMIQAVPKADVIVTNPTHYAVALLYDEAKAAAPVVVAKGKDYLAQKIKEKARACGIELVENRELAQGLYFYCEVGEQVPEDMYQAVAEILAYVYRLKGRQGGR